MRVTLAGIRNLSISRIVMDPLRQVLRGEPLLASTCSYGPARSRKVGERGPPPCKKGGKKEILGSTCLHCELHVSPSLYNVTTTNVVRPLHWVTLHMFKQCGLKSKSFKGSGFWIPESVRARRNLLRLVSGFPGSPNYNLQPSPGSLYNARIYKVITPLPFWLGF